MKVVQAINKEDIVRVHEFTTVLDGRELPCILEITGDIGRASFHLASQHTIPTGRLRTQCRQPARKPLKHWYRRTMSINMRSTRADSVVL